MQLKPWGARLALAALFLASALACRVTDIFIAQATVTPTRTLRPTFTAIPPATVTPEPTWTPAPTQPPPPPPPTARPTTRPTARPPTARPATQPPAPPPAQPTTSPFLYHANAPGCEHAGGVFVKARVFGNASDPNSGVEGVKVALGDKNGSRFDIPPVTTTWDGTYSFTLSSDGAPPYKGTVYVWLVDNGGNRISDIGGPMVFNGLGPDAPGTCWHGWVDFWK